MTAPIRILRIITRLNIGGPAIHATILSTKLDPRACATCLVTGALEQGEGDLSDLVRSAAVRVVHLPSLRRPLHPWRDLVSFVQLVRQIWQERPQIIHTHLAKAGTLGRLAGLLWNGMGPGRRPEERAVLIHTFHGHVLEGYFSPWLSRFFITIERFLAARTDCLIAVSPAIRDELLQLGIGRLEQWRVIELGLDLTPFAQLPMRDGNGTVRVGLIGRLVPIKNPALLLQALEQLARGASSPVASSVIVGDGPLRAELEREARARGLQPHVQFTGWRRDLPSVYQNVDVVCLTSRNEGTPVTVIEAMAAGRTVVATDVGGVRDLLGAPEGSAQRIGPGGFEVTARGILVRSDDADALARALGAAATDGTLRRRLGESARAFAMQRYNANRLVRDMMELYTARTEGT